MSQNEFAVREQLWDLIKDIKFGMLVTQRANGQLHSRPMTTQNSRLDEDATLWFFVSSQGDAVSDLQRSPSICMTYADPQEDRFVSVSGRAQVNSDAATKQQLWSPLAKSRFPGGVDDPNLVLVRLNITQADYWDVKANKLVQLWRTARAAVTGKPPTGLGEHASVNVREDGAG